jgi:hypothetical protein
MAHHYTFFERNLSNFIISLKAYYRDWNGQIGLSCPENSDQIDQYWHARRLSPSC